MGSFFSISINNDKRLINIKREKKYLFCFYTRLCEIRSL